jgi:hypothetical protein
VCFCIQLANFYKYNSIINQPTDSNASHRSVVIACVCFVYSLPTFTNTTDSNASRRSVVIACVCFVYSLPTFTNTSYTTASSINQPIATHRIAVLSFHACVL